MHNYSKIEAKKCKSILQQFNVHHLTKIITSIPRNWTKIQHSPMYKNNNVQCTLIFVWRNNWQFFKTQSVWIRRHVLPPSIVIANRVYVKRKNERHTHTHTEREMHIGTHKHRDTGAPRVLTMHMYLWISFVCVFVCVPRVKPLSNRTAVCIGVCI